MAVTKIRELLANQEPYCVMAPQVFDGLRIWLAALAAFAETGHPEDLRARLEGSSPDLLEVLEELGALRAAEEAAAQVKGSQLSRRLREWNDAFRTLKLLHTLRDRGAGEMPLADAASALADMKARARH